MKKSVLFLFLALSLCLAGTSLGAQELRINVATVAPEKSPYGVVLRKMAAEWSRISNGKVKLRPFFGDKLGDEEVIVQKIRSNSLQGAMLTLAGLAYIDKPLMTISAPLLIQNDQELKYVLDKLMPDIDAGLNAQGFTGIAYSPAGWLNFFAKKEFHTPDDLRNMKLGISNKSKEIYSAFQAMRYKIVSVDISETLANLLTNRSEALFTSPLVAGSYNWVGSARYMLDIKISPFFGGLIINNKTWDRIDPDLQKKLKKSAQDLAMSELYSALDQMEADAIKTMIETKGGMILVKSTDAERTIWKQELESGLEATLGTAFDKDMYEKVKAILAEYRKNN